MADPVYTQRPWRRMRQVLVRAAVAVTLTALAFGVVALICGVVQSPQRAEGELKDYGLPFAEVLYAPARDGSVRVAEYITFDFNGSFSGAYRDVPKREGDALQDFLVCDPGPGVVANPERMPQQPGECPEGMQEMLPNAPTALGSHGAPGTYGLEDMGNAHRIVWHFDAGSGPRTFLLLYTARGWLSEPRGDGGGGDSVFLTVVPWGPEWKATLSRLEARVVLPAGVEEGDVRTFGAASSAARVRRSGSAGITATSVAPAEQVDMLAVLPAEPFAEADLRQERRSAREILSNARREQDQSRERARDWAEARQGLGRRLVLGSLLGLLAGAAWVALAWRLSLREVEWPAHVPRLLPDPPDDLGPALAAALVEQRKGASRNALVATVFELVRRDQWQTLPAQGKKRGVRVDIALKNTRQEREDVSWIEEPVRRMIDAIVAKDKESGVAMGEFGKLLKKDLKLSRRVSDRQEEFERQVKREISRANWYTRGSVVWLWAPFLVILLPALVSTFQLLQALAAGDDPNQRIGGLQAAPLLVFLTGLGVVLLSGLTSRELTTRWRPAIRERAARWTAYRDFLDNYGDMQDEQTASIELWERHLVYATAFGCARDVLDAVRPGVDKEAATADGFDRSPLTYMQVGTFSRFESGMATRAPEPSSSGDSGFSGGFSGGGGFGGGGGGGGGAW